MKIAVMIIVALLSGNLKIAKGSFNPEMTHKGFDMQGNEYIYYQFKSEDDSVWWTLTEKEIGEVPDFNCKYALVFDNKGTTAENKNCGCPEEYDCECELYDDEFITIRAYSS